MCLTKSSRGLLPERQSAAAAGAGVEGENAIKILTRRSLKIEL